MGCVGLSIEFVMKLPEAPAARDRFVQYGTPGHLLHVLPEVADRQPLRNGHVALVGRFLADDHPEQRGLAGPVGPDKTDLFARIELKGRVDKQDLFAVLLADLCE